MNLKFGVIGLGWFGQKHCEALVEIPGVQLYSLCTRTQSRLDELSDRFGVEEKHTDHREMLG